MLTSKIRRRIELPHEPEQWVEVRQLSYLQLDLASDVSTLRSMNKLGQLDAGTRQQMAEIQLARFRNETTVAEVVVADDPLTGYDVQTLLQAGVIAWSYDEAVTPESVDQLDEATAEYVARELVPKTESETDRKNGSPNSMRPSTVAARHRGNG